MRPAQTTSRMRGSDLLNSALRPSPTSPLVNVKSEFGIGRVAAGSKLHFFESSFFLILPDKSLKIRSSILDPQWSKRTIVQWEWLPETCSLHSQHDVNKPGYESQA